MTRGFFCRATASAFLIGACGGTNDEGGPVSGAGGTAQASGGMIAQSGGGTPSGGQASGGLSFAGGSPTGGTGIESGGSPQGTGAEGSGGEPSDGGADGGSGAQGGTQTGGQASGGQASGGQASGGQASGGRASGGQPGSGGDSASGGAPLAGLSWPIDCIPSQTCVNLDWPDIDDDNIAHDCGLPGYQGHQGTDIGVTWEQMDEGVDVWAAADGVVFFASDGKYDRCPNENEPDCQRPEQFLPGDDTGTNVCTDNGPYCGTGTGSCFWCFAGGNVVVILHDEVQGVFATRYDHLKRDSILVQPGDTVKRGDVIAQVGSAGNSTGPHLHFEVWDSGYYELAEPWAGECGPNQGPSLWSHEPPWSKPE